MVSDIAIEKPEASWLIAPVAPQEPTEEQIKNGASNSEVLDLISENNQGIWQQDRDKLRSLQDYVKKLIERGVIK